MSKTYPFTIDKLPYDYNALEPYIDTETMHFHHDKHHQAYANNLNNALENYPKLHNKTLEDLLKDINTLPIEIQTKIKNNAGGVYNHDLYFGLMMPNSPKKPVGEIALAIDRKFGSFDNFKETFKKAALDRFGSGWAWLVADKNNELMVISTPNQDVPLQLEVNPLLLIDVWEHAYYLKYQNKRTDYIDNFFNVINWENVNQLYIKK